MHSQTIDQAAARNTKGAQNADQECGHCPSRKPEKSWDMTVTTISGHPEVLGPEDAVPGPVRRWITGLRHSRPTLGALGVLTMAVLLEIAPRGGIVDSRFVPPFSEMLASLGGHLQEAQFWSALGDTLTTWSLGLLLAMAGGIAFGIVIGSVSWLRQITVSTIEFLRPIPSVALIPLVILLYGTGMQATLVLVVYAAFWQILIQVLYGVQDVDPVAMDTARSYRFSNWTRARMVVWPAALPYVVTGFRLAATVALILTITGELIVGTPGLGQMVFMAQQSGAVSSMYAMVIVTGLLGVAVNAFARLVERRMLHWHPSVRREGNA
jgi:ABC-type nitrate/sulfonate/bicarbonate transport system permease component